MDNGERELIIKIKRLDNAIKNYRKNNKLLYYNSGGKVHLKQLLFHQSLKRNRWVFGGNRSGKTECGAAEAVWLARGNHPYRQNRANVTGWVVSVSTAVQRDVAQAKILNYLNKDWIDSVVMLYGKSSDMRGGVIDYITIKNVFGGVSKIGFKSAEMGREKFQGTSLDFVWFDEEPPRDIYDECRMRVVDTKGDIFGTMTPLKGRTFIYNKIYLNEDNDQNIWHISMEWADNPYLDKDEIESVTKTMSAHELNVRRYGKFSDGNSGLVYNEFNEAVHVIEPFDIPKEYYNNISIDPGLNNPLSAHFYAVDGDGTVFVAAEHYEAGKDVVYHSEAIKRICAALEWHSDFKGRYSALIDSAASQKTLAYSKSVAELFYEQNINVNTRVNKDLFYGINQVKKYLRGESGKPRLYIFSTCVNLIREIKCYAWAEGDVPKKKDDHALDELRYFICSLPKASPPQGKKGEIALDKERLYTKLKRARRNIKM